MTGSFPIGVMLLAWSSALLAQERILIEEIIVTAQRIEESAETVPISLSAFSEAMIEERQIIGLADLHINAPNVTFTSRQGDSTSNFNIRGIGLIPISVGVEKPTAVHINEIPLPRLYAGLEFYDLERVEVLRGPQGTLYGRNATAGALNIVTQKPSFDGFKGRAKLEYGDYDHRRLTAALNIPISESLAFRVAGIGLKRDGYIDNKAGGQIPGVDKDVDARDHYALRITGSWNINEQVNLWVMYDRFDEDSTRTWRAAAICKHNNLPVGRGCEPNQFGRDKPNPNTEFIVVALGLAGVIPLGAHDAATGLQIDFPDPANLGDRDVFIDGNFLTTLEEEIWSFGLNWTLDQWRFDVTGAYQQTDWRYVSAGNFTSFGLGPTATNPSGLWPMSAFGPPGFLRSDRVCNADAYQAGVLGGCIADAPQTRAVGTFTLQDDLEYWSIEAKVRSQFGGPWNFLLGTTYAADEVSGEFIFANNVFDSVSLDGWLGTRFYPGFAGVEKSGNESENYAVFGELYWQPTDSLTFTVGVRYNEDQKRPNEALVGFSSVDANSILGGSLGPDPQWVRGELLGYLFGNPEESGIALAEYYDATDDISAATNPIELIAALQIVPPIPRPGEQRALSGRSSQLTYKEWSGRFVVDWAISPTTMLYAKYNRGFKPGAPGTGVDPDLESETVDSVEVGAKSRLFGDSLHLSAAAFAYKYHDMQIGSGGGSGQAAGQNVDVNGHGVELEATWQPLQIPGLIFNLAYGWLDVEFGDALQVDFRNLTQGNPDYIELNSRGGTYVARVADVLPLVDQAIADGGAVGEAGAPGTVYSNGIPAFFSRDYLENNGVDTLDGLPADLKGNRTPLSPRHNLNLGAAYSWYLNRGTLTARWDYYWQDKSYGSVLNAPIDKIDSWGQHNLSLTFESANNRWVTRFWARNVTNENNVLAREDRILLIYGEPRIFGVSVQYNVGL